MADGVRRTFPLESPPDNVDTVHDLLASLWNDAPQVPKGDRISFETALIELAANVMTYADPDGVECTLVVEVTDTRITATLTDSGVEANIPLTDRDMPGELQEAGRGLPLMRALVHEIEYTRDGDLNRWRIARNLGG